MTRRAGLLVVVLFGVAALGGCVAETGSRGEIVALGEECSDGSGIGARPFDAERECVGAPVLLCAESGLTEVEDCAEDASTGELYRTSYPVRFDRQDAWAPCAESDEVRVLAARPCAD